MMSIGEMCCKPQHNNKKRKKKQRNRVKINRYLSGRLFAISTAALLRNDEAGALWEITERMDQVLI